MEGVILVLLGLATGLGFCAHLAWKRMFGPRFVKRGKVKKAFRLATHTGPSGSGSGGFYPVVISQLEVENEVIGSPYSWNIQKGEEVVMRLDEDGRFLSMAGEGYSELSGGWGMPFAVSATAATVMLVLSALLCLFDFSSLPEKQGPADAFPFVFLACLMIVQLAGLYQLANYAVWRTWAQKLNKTVEKRKILTVNPFGMLAQLEGLPGRIAIDADPKDVGEDVTVEILWHEQEPWDFKVVTN